MTCMSIFITSFSLLWLNQLPVLTPSGECKDINHWFHSHQDGTWRPTTGTCHFHREICKYQSFYFEWSNFVNFWKHVNLLLIWVHKTIIELHKKIFLVFSDFQWYDCLSVQNFFTHLTVGVNILSHSVVSGLFLVILTYLRKILYCL